MAELVRFSVSMDEALLKRFDLRAKRRGAANRSEAIRDLIRCALVEEEWEAGKGPSMAAVVLVYDHHTRELDARLNRIQHEQPEAVVSSLHIHVDKDTCMEVVVLRGQRRVIQDVAYRLIGARGVIHGRLVASTTGRGLS